MNQLKKSRLGKKAAIEFSVTTIIVIVLAVIMLIMGIVLIRNIYGVSTKSVNIIDDKMTSELQKLFTDENKNFVIYLGQDKTARIRAGTTDFGIAVGAQSINNIAIDSPDKIQYKIELVDEGSSKSCIKLLGKTKTTSMFGDPLNSWVNSTSANGPVSGRIITLTISEDTRTCIQLVRVTAIDRTADVAGETIAFDTFKIEILKKGLF